MRPSKPPVLRNKLSVPIIVDAAIAILEEAGFSHFSMRRLASALGVTATAIYHHIADKSSLLDLCAERILGRIPVPDPDAKWTVRLKTLILDQQRVCLAFPGLARYLVSHRDSSAAAMLWMDGILEVMQRGGMDGPTALRALIAMSFVLNPMTLIEDAPRKRKTSMMNKTWASRVLKKNPGKFPHAAALLPHFGDLQDGGYFYESHFELALDRLIAGLERETATGA